MARGYAQGNRGFIGAGKPANVVNVAIAASFGKLRIAAFVWAIATNEHVRLA